MVRSAGLQLFSIMFIVAVGPALAQQDNSTNPPTAPSASAPLSAPTTPNLTVASVKLQGGLRASKLIGSAVYNDQNEKVGSVDDLIIKDGNRDRKLPAPMPRARRVDLSNWAVEQVSARRQL